MPKYQFNNIRENPEFQEFVKSNWHRDVGSVQDYEIEAMFYQFKSRSNDMSPQDLEFVNEIADSAQPKELDDLTSVYYPGKKYADLSEEDKSFVAVTNSEAKDLNISLDDIKEFLRAQNLSAGLGSENTNEQTPLEIGLDSDDKTKEHTSKETLTQDDIPSHTTPSQTQKDTPEAGQTSVPPHEPENPKPVREEEEARIRSFNSDENEALLDMVKVDALHEMGVITDDDLNKLSKLPEEQVRNNINLLNDKLPKMSQQQLAEFEDKVTDRMLGNDELFALVPPTALAKAYTGLDAKIAQEQDDTKKQDLTAKKDKVGARMEQLTTMLAKNDHTFDDLYFADTTNIADVYEGYVKMYDAMDKNWRSPNDGGPLAQQMRQGEYKLREVYSQYREDYNLKNVTAKDADKLQKRYEDLNKQLSGIEIDENTAKLVSNFKFLDEQGLSLIHI